MQVSRIYGSRGERFLPAGVRRPGSWLRKLCVATLFGLVASVGGTASAQTCPADDGAPCDSNADDDLCTDGVFVCTGSVGTCREGPLVYLPLDENTGTVAVNAAANPTVGDGTYGSQVSFDTGYPNPGGYAIAFPGSNTDAWIRIPAGEAPHTTFTWSFWVNSSTSGKTVFSRTTGAAIDGFSYLSDGTLYVGGSIVSSAPLVDGAWTHVTITFDGTGVAIYHDSTLETYQPVTFSPTWVSDVWFGQRQTLHNAGLTGADAFAGVIDEITYHGYALDSAEVTDLFAVGVPFQQKNRELCDGLDNDCRSDTVDPQGEPCDGADTDQCENGTTTCVAFGLLTECNNETVENIVETCNQTDDDCNGITDDAPGVGDPCDTGDPDSCPGGRRACHPLNTSLTCGAEPILFLDFDVSDGPQMIIDRTSFQHSAQLLGSTAVTSAGHTGNGLEHEGDGAEVYQTSTISAAFGTITVAMWINPKDNSASRLFSKLGYLEIRRDTAGAIGVTRDGTTPTNFFGKTPVGVWSHVLVSRLGSQVSIYVNGELVGTDTRTDGAGDSSNNRSPLQLGLGYVGQMDDVLLFRRALTQLEAVRLHADPLYYTVSNEICGLNPADGDCDGNPQAAGSAGCTPYFRDTDGDGFGGQTIVNMGPVAYWSMDALDADGNLADWSEVGTSLQLSTTAPATFRRVRGQVGMAIQFEPGRNQELCTAVSTNSPLYLTESISFGTWIRNDWPDEHRILHNRANLVFSVQSDGHLSYTADGSSPVVSANKIPTGAWTHVGFSHSGSEARLYINGVLDKTATHAAAKQLSVACLGGFLGTARMDGLLDEAVLFPRVLTDAEFLTLSTVQDHDCLCAPAGFFTEPVAGDCVDGDGGINPSAAEVCDGQDNNCSRLVDDIAASACTPSSPVSGCTEGIDACSGTSTVCSTLPWAGYGFDEGTGDYAFNEVIEGRTLALTGTSWVSGNTGSAVSTAGGGSIQGPVPATFLQHGGVAFRFNPAASTASLVSSLITFPGLNADLLLKGGDLVVSASASITGKFAGRWLIAGQWNHVAMVWHPVNALDEEVVVYVNGVERLRGVTDLGTSDWITLGGEGAYDDVVFYDVEPPASVIAMLASTELPQTQKVRERCDDLDNDCDGETDEAHDGWIAGSSVDGAACDTKDLDLCTEGTWICQPGNVGVRCSDGPVGHYPFEGTDAATAIDHGGDLGAGTFNGTRNAGNSGNGLRLTSSQHLTADSPTVVSLHHGSAAVWFKRLGVGSNLTILSITGPDGSIELDQDNGGLILGAGGRTITAPGTIGINWVHLTVTWDRSLDLVRLYVDGTLAATLSGLNWGAGSAVTSLTLGDTSGTSMPGDYDDLVVYRRAIEQAEIVGLAAGTPNPTLDNRELCDGVDNNCDASTDEGFGVGAGCDADDADLCDEGETRCISLYASECGGDGPTVYYPLDGNGGEALDMSGAGAHGIVYGAVTAAGRVGTARAFDGVNDSITLPSYARMGGGERAHSVALWVYPTDDSVGVLFERPGQFSVRRNADRTISYKSSVSGSTYVGNGKHGFVAPNNWSHVVVTWDGATVRYYVNASLAAQHAMTGSIGIGSVTNTPSAIGCQTGPSGCTSSWFKGSLDDLSVYDYALSEAEILALVGGVPSIRVNARQCGADADCDSTTDGDGSVDCTTWWVDPDGDGFGDPAWVTALAPELYFSMEDSDGALVRNQGTAGSGYGATRRENPIRRDGYRGRALEFDATSGHSYLTANLAFGNPYELTTAFWFRASGSGTRALIARPAQFNVVVNSADQVQFSGFGSSATLTSSILPDRWYFLVVRISKDGSDPADVELELHTGSVLQESRSITGSGGGLSGGGSPLLFGSLATPIASNAFTGYIDEIAVWDSLVPDLSSMRDEDSHRCACAQPAGMTGTTWGDCAPTDNGIHPGATELCDGIDQNCNTIADDGANADCDDGKTCTDDACTAGSCTHAVVIGRCYIGGICYGPGDLSPTSVCSRCDPNISGTSFTDLADGSVCSDNDACTENDQCLGGACGGTPRNCDDGKLCTIDSCDSATGCTYADNDGATVPCYTGDPATENVGECVGGTATCSGATLGSCSGEVTPQVEVCDGLDNDCDGETDEDFNVGDACDSGDPGSCKDGVITCVSLSSAVCAFDGPIVWGSFDAVATNNVPNESWGGKLFFLQGGASPTTGPAGFGDAVSLDGVNDYVAAQSHTSLGGSPNELSIGLWVRRTAAGRQSIVRNQAGSFNLQVRSGTLQLGTSSNTIDSGVELPADGVWTHLAIVFDHGTLRFYVDGMLRSTRTISNPQLVLGSSGTWYFGSAPNGSYSFLAGGVDDIIMETAAWSDTRVQAYYRPSREACDGTDTNCDGSVDEGFTKAPGACDGPDADQCALGTAQVCHPAGHEVHCQGDGPTRLYRMESIDGRFIYSGSGGAAPLMVYNGALVAGNDGQALQFDGTTRAELPTDTTQSASYDGGVSVWVRFDTNGDMVVLSKSASNGSDELVIERNDGFLRLRIAGSSHGFPSAVLGEGVWHHLAVAISGSTVSAWHNGVALAPFTEAGANAGSTDESPWTVGADRTSNSIVRPLVGAIDELTFYAPGALDQTAVANAVTFGDACNNVDDDCDGTTDEGFELEGNLCFGASTCVVSGTWTCDVTLTQLECDGTIGLPGAACDDGDPCTYDDTCALGGGCEGTAYTCDDGLPCTDKICNGDGTCAFPPKPGFCAIGSTCYDDGDENPTEPCGYCDIGVSQTGFTDRSDGTACDDGSLCTTTDTCSSGTCGGPALTCDDGDDCTVDACDPLLGCIVASVLTGGEPCDDGDACVENTTCSTGGACTGGNAVDCDDGNPCTADVCNVATGCVYTVIPYTEACYDGPAGTANIGLCKNGQRTCTGSVLGPCLNQVVPTADVCDGKDNNCDGTADEAYPTKGDACDSDDVDACANGTLTCLGDGTGLECTGDFQEPEICDGKDNDCNGLTDELFPELGDPCDSPDDTDSCMDGVYGCFAGGVACLYDGPTLSLTGTNATRYRAVDVSANGNDALRYGFPVNPGTGPFEFDGVDDTMTVAASPTLTLTDTFTIVAHVNRQAVTGTVSIIESRTGGCSDVAIRVNSSGAPFAFVEQSECGIVSLPGAVALTAGTWYHLALVADGAEFRFYVDGVLKSTKPQTGALYEIGDFEIGGIGGGLAPYKGRMGEIAVYRSALDASTIGTLSAQFSAPGGAQVEICDGADNNCDTVADEHATAEVCDGVDNNCDGSVDEGFAGLGDPCDDADGDVCSFGARTCHLDGTTAACAGDGAAVLYRMEYGSGTTVFDYAGTGHATATGGTWTTGFTGGGLELTGGAQASVTGYPELAATPTGEFTIVAQLKPLALTDGIFFEGEGRYSLGTTSTGQVVCTIHGVGAAASDLAVTSKALLTVGDWTGVACIYDGHSVRLYTDGVLRTMVHGIKGVPGAGTGVFRFGGVDAVYDDVAVYNGVVNESRIAIWSTVGIPVVERTREICDALDNDCDGTKDEGFETKGTSCDGDFDGCENGTLECDDAGNLSCLGDIPANGTELCNGLDDTCDGVTDEGFEAKGDACDGPDADSCPNGVLACNVDGDGLECVGDTVVAELCNGIDDDCDGLTDEDFQLGQACDGGDPDQCTDGVWACRSDGSGTRFCDADGAIIDFRLEEGSGSQITSVDREGVTALVGSASWTTGPNKAALDHPAGSAVSVTVSAGAPTNLTLYARARSSSGSGDTTLLEQTGGFQLTVRPSGLICRISGLAPAGCSASLTGHRDSLHDFACTFDGSAYHLYYDGLEVANCPALGAMALSTNPIAFGSVGATDTAALTERVSVYDRALDAAAIAGLVTGGDACDGVDNDCDGDTDEDFPTLGDACDGPDADICTDGTLTCSFDRLAVECTGEVDDIELCDGVDNDCDGDTDEDFPGIGDACDGPDGDVCANGVITCKVDGTGSECAGDLNQPEICDGLDNDCNGITDDALVGLGVACDGDDTDTCTDGVTYCDSAFGGERCDEVGAVLWTPLNDSAGTTAPADKSRFNRELTATNVVFDGTAATFDGTADISPNAASFTDLDGAAKLTIAAWVRPTFSASGAALPVVTQLNDVSNLVFDLSLRQNGIRFRLRTSGEGGAGTTYECIPGQAGCSAFLIEDEWAHVAVTFNGSTVTLWVNGQRVRVMDSTGNPVGTLSGSVLRIGSAPPNRYHGQLRDVIVMPKELNGAELRALKDNGPTGNAIELCNGVDDTCEGDADEAFTTLGDACDGVDGDVCSTGTVQCSGDGYGVRCVDTEAVAWWPLDGSGGIEAIDHGTSGSHGTMRRNTTFVTGKIGDAVEFVPDAGRSRIEAGKADLVGALGKATWMAWVRTDTVTGTSAIVSTYNPAGSPGASWSFERSADGLALRLRTTSSPTTKIVNCNSSTTCGTLLTVGAWTHVAVVANLGQNRFYVNGQPVGTFGGGGSTIANIKSNERLVIGAWTDGSSEWDGAIDDVRIYPDALSSNTIRTIYEQATDSAAFDPCDGIDNDCDGLTDEDFPDKDAACDGPDTDQCTNGTWTCSSDGRSLECINESETDIVEICNALDDDCDGDTDEDFPDAGKPCDGPDGDSCAEGIYGCTISGGLTCQYDGPIGLWRLDTGGTVGVDSAQNSPKTDLTLNGVFWEPGKFGQALEFDGGGGNATATLGINGTRTLMMWVRPTAGGFVFSESAGAGNTHFSAFWAGGALQYQHQDGATSHVLSGTLPSNEWHHVAVVMEPGNAVDGLKLFIDCVQVDARGLNANPANGEFSLGRLKGNASYFSGRIDEVALFPYVVQPTALCSYATTGIPAINANRELCDGLDNDCNGDTDDGLTGKPTEVCDGDDTDLCQNGTWTCRADTVDVECINETAVNIGELCNALDDDCDGATDEDFTYQSEGIGFPCDPPGLCGPGAVECISPTEAGCTTGPGGSADQSSPEFCDGKDNDCDGDTDEKPDGTPVTENCYTGPPGTLNVGACRFGQRTCSSGVFGPCLGDIVPAATDDECDGIDDNCDGLADEGWGDGIFCTVDNCSGGVQNPVPDDSLCDNGNPCQNHICTADPGLPDGCQYTPNNSNVPDPAVWGKACNLAICSGGFVDYSADPTNLPDDGLSCTTDSCAGNTPVYTINPGTCLIDGQCYAEGEVNAADGCKVCSPQESNNSWSNILQRGDFTSSGDVEGYTVTDLSGGGIGWVVDSQRQFSGTHSLYLGNPATHSYEAVGGAVVHARAEGEAVTIPADIRVQLTWYVWMETEEYTGSEKYDTLFLYVKDASTGTRTLVWDSMNEFGSHTGGGFRKALVDLSDFAGQTVHLVWEFDTGDAFFNDYEGVYLDEIRMLTGCCFNHGDCPSGVECTSYLCVNNTCEGSDTCSVCTRSQSTVVFGLDRSISMGSLHGGIATRWDATRAALDTLLGTWDSQLNLGMKLMGSTGVADVCNDVTPLLDLDFHSSAELLASSVALELVQGGLSPIARTLQEINAAYANPAVQLESGNKFVIMIVDGTETCLDDDAVALQLAALRTQGVRTIFVAFDSVWTQAQKDTMNTYAIAGGLPVPRVAIGDPVYLSAGNNAATLEAALTKAITLTVTEACNGVDDDCDGTADDAAPELACNLTCNGGLGGRQLCGSNGLYTACTQKSIPEICDGLDNDCDGETDEDWPQLGLPCSEGVGACFSTGVYQCNGQVTGSQIECNAPPIAGTTELCNNVDDDCDGDTDEALTQFCSTACGTGEATCEAGKFVNCDAEPPTIEVCDGLDNDCNGVVDDVVPVPCTGACGAGFQVCTAGVVTGCDSDGEPETCNGIDDDCDGFIDNAVTGDPTLLTQFCTISNGLVGACAQGIQTCTAGTFGVCVPDQLPTPEVCNGIDDDCDGETDNTGTGVVTVGCYDGPAGTEGVGVCKAGTRTCLDDGTLGSCADQVLPGIEVCDGLDNDCDGETDESPGTICATTSDFCATTAACLCGQDQEGVWRCYLD